MTDPISDRDRNGLWRFMIEHFDLAGLKDLAFDLAADHRLYTHPATPELASQLIEYCERRGQLNPLVAAVVAHAPDPTLAAVLARLPASTPVSKVQLKLDQDLLAPVPAFKVAMARRLNVSPQVVSLVAAASGSLRLLIGVPEATVAVLAGPEPGTGGLLDARPFKVLGPASQQTWRLVAQIWPPDLQDQTLRPSVTWDEAIEMTRQVLSHISTSFRALSREYIATLQSALAHLPLEPIEQVIDILLKAQRSDQRVFIIGSAVSGLMATNFAAELEKSIGVRATSLSDAEDAEDDLSRRLQAQLQPGDVVIGMSPSGRGAGVFAALAVARRAGAATIGFTGSEGEPLADVVDLPIVIPSADQHKIEDAHLIVQHIICTTLQESQRQGQDPLRRSRQELSESFTPSD